MKNHPFIFSVLVAALTTGCTVGPNYSKVVIETAQPNFADVDYARVIAERVNRNRGGGYTGLGRARQSTKPSTASIGP